ncbi:hypothetical protein [Hamadaea tsunoensis]|uniref:hypothetical protein n=1 Tax=Hamadaea tsunoensis TaxID=53368 RepID=UPI000401D6BD|nr:hypothetical protein [Hamadaea tsunoensis]
MARWRTATLAMLVLLAGCSFGDDGFEHRYAAPGTGCGDLADSDSGKSDIWSRSSGVLVSCAKDHSVLAPPKMPGARVYWTESDVDYIDPPDLKKHGYAGTAIEVTAEVLTGGPEARGGIVVDPVPALQQYDADLPVFFFAVDSAGRWFIDRHDHSAQFAADVASGAVAPGPHRIRVRTDASKSTSVFAVDGTDVATQILPPAKWYTVGVGVACSRTELNEESCTASMKDYQSVWWK